MATRRHKETVYHDVPAIPGHQDLTGRSLPDQHPIDSISGLADTLDVLLERSRVSGGKVDALEINGEDYEPDENKVVHFEIPVTGTGDGLVLEDRTVSIDPEVTGEIADLDSRLTAQETAGYATETYVTNADGVLAATLRSEIGAVDDSAVHKTGTEYISGKKTFLGHTLVPAPSTGDEAVNRDYLDSRIGGEYPYTELTTTDWREYFEGDGRAKYDCYFMLGSETRFYLRGQAPDPKDFHVHKEGTFDSGASSYSFDMYPTSFLNGTNALMLLHTGTVFYQNSSAGISLGAVTVRRPGGNAKIGSDVEIRWYKKSYGTIPSGGLTLRFFLAAPEEVLPPAPAPDPSILKYTDYGSYSVVTGFASTAAQTASIEIPSEHNGLPVTEIGANAFKSVTKLSQVKIPGSVKTISASAFQGCTALTTVIFTEDGLELISASAFQGCTHLETIHLPDSLITLAADIFTNTAVKVLELGPNLQNISADTIRSMQIVEVDEDNPYYVSEDNVIYTPDETSIIAYACQSLNPTLAVKPTVQTIGDHAFDGAKALTSITLPSGLTSIGTYAFRNCTGLTSAVLPDTVTSLGDYAYYGCTKIQTVRCSNKLTTIPAGAFQGCTALTAVTRYTRVSSIGNYAFSGCSALASAPMASPLATVGNYAFQKCVSLVSVAFPATLTSIGAYAFSECSGIATLDLGSIAVLPAYAFNKCTGLTALDFPDTLTAIETTTFSGCTLIQTCAVGTGLASGLPLPDTCGLLTAYTVASGNAVYSDDNGVLYEGTVLVQMPQSWPDSSYSVRAGTTEIRARAFYVCSGLNTLTLPSGITAIPERMCYDCTGLTSIIIPAGVTGIGAYAFQMCRALGTVTLPSSVTSIGTYAFQSCTALTSIGLSSVTSIGQYAFQGCTGLPEVTIAAESVSRYAFDGCTGLRTVIMTDAVKTIIAYAFDDCTGVTSVTFGTGLTTLNTSWSPWRFYYDGSRVQTASGLKGYTWVGVSYLNLERQ